MLYYFNTHLQPLAPKDYEKGTIGYTGVLQEIIAQVHFRGTDRLMRKLSADVNELIFNNVLDPDRRQLMIARAENLAAQHAISLYASEVKDVAKGVDRMLTKEKGMFSWMECLSTFSSPEESTTMGPATAAIKDKHKDE